MDENKTKEQLLNELAAMRQWIAELETSESELKRVEQALAHERDLLRALMDNIPDTIYFKDTASRFTRINRAQAQVLGVSDSKEAIGKTDFDFFTPEHARDAYADEQEIVKSGQPLMDKVERIRRANGQVRWVSATKVPIMDEEGRVIGTVGISRDITERKLAEEETRRRNRELDALNAIATTMMQSALNLDQVLQRVADGVVEGLGCNTAFIFLLDEEEGVFKGGAVSTKAKMLARMNAIIGFPLLRIKIPARRDFNEAASNLLDGRATIKHDLHELVSPLLSRPVCFAMQRLLDSKTFFTMPLLAKGKTVGGIIASTRDELSERDTEKLMPFANQSAIAIENARLYEAERDQRELAEALRDTAETLNSTLDFNEVLDRILTNAGRVVPHHAADIMLVDSAGIVSIVRSKGYVERDLEEWVKARRFPLADFPTLREIVKSKQPLAIPDTQADVGWVDVPETRWIRSYVCAPIPIEDQVVGFISLTSTTPGTYNSAHAERLQIFANQAATAIENARLYQETQQRALEQETLREAALALTTALDRNRVIERILAQLQRVVPYDSASVQLLREDRMELVGGRGFPNLPDLLGASFPADGDNPNSEVIRTRAPFIVEDAPAVYEVFREGPHRQIAIRSWLGVPMLVGERLVGMIALDKREPGFYTQEHARLAEAFAAQAAVAFENARLFEEIGKRRVYLEGVLGAAPDAIVTLDAHHRIVEWNPGAERLFGYSQEEAIGQNLDHLVTNPDVFEEAVGFTQTAMGGGETPPTETVRYRKDGSPVDVIVAGSPIVVGDELIGTVAVYTDITARKRMEETLRALALVDDLTGLYNRRGFLALAEQQLKAAHRAKRRMALLFADFDGLKQINDTFGHPEGDRALIETADVFRETFRESDIIARIAGDEFVVLAIETDGSPAEVLARRLQENLKARNVRKSLRYKLSLSMGLARYDPERPCSIDELLIQADRAMYEKKRGE